MTKRTYIHLILVVAFTVTAVLGPGFSGITPAIAQRAKTPEKKSHQKQQAKHHQRRKAQVHHAHRRAAYSHSRARVHVRVWHAPVYWQPIGFTLTVLAVTAIVVSWTSGGQGGAGEGGSDDEQEYYYDQGTWMKKEANVYVVIPAPVGAAISELPDGFEKTQASSETYYYYAGDFYKDHEGGKYIVVKAPFGAQVSVLPEGYEDRNAGTEEDPDYYYVYNGVWYEAVSDGEDVLFVVTPAP